MKTIGLKRVVAAARQARSLDRLTQEFANIYPYFDEWIAQVRPDLACGKRLLYVITEGDREVGFFLVHPLEYRVLKANALLILDAVRHRGVATAAYRCLLKEAAGEYDLVVTQAKRDNNVALRLLQRVGFVELGTLEHLVERAKDNRVFVYVLKSEGGETPIQELTARAYNEPGKKRFIPDSA